LASAAAFSSRSIPGRSASGALHLAKPIVRTASAYCTWQGITRCFRGADRRLRNKGLDRPRSETQDHGQ
jgi:hypothetical protein